MGRRTVTIYVSGDLYNTIEVIRDEEDLDRSTVIARLLEQGVDDWRLELATRRYRAGECSLGRAAEYADISLWDYLEHLGRLNIDASYGTNDFDQDVDVVRDK